MAHPRRVAAGHRSAETRARRVRLPNQRFDEEVVAAVQRLRASGRAVTVGAIQTELRSLNYQAGKRGVEASASRLGIAVNNPDGASTAQKALKSLRQSGRY